MSKCCPIRALHAHTTGTYLELQVAFHGNTTTFDHTVPPHRNRNRPLLVNIEVMSAYKMLNICVPNILPLAECLWTQQDIHRPHRDFCHILFLSWCTSAGKLKRITWMCCDAAPHVRLDHKMTFCLMMLNMFNFFDKVVNFRKGSQTLGFFSRAQ